MLNDMMFVTKIGIENELDLLMKMRVRSLEDAYQQEKQSFSLYATFDNYLKNHQDELALYQKWMDKLLNKSNDITRFILDKKFHKKISSFSFSQNQKIEILKIGIIKFLEKEAEIIKKLKQEIKILHPRKQFPETRKMKRHFVIHVGPTNSGKTYHAIEKLKNADSGMYLAPIKALGNEIFHKLNQEGVACDLITGDESVRTSGAKHTSSTIEIADFERKVDVAVVDEVQLIEDKQRGYAWIKAIFGLQAKEIHLCGALHVKAFILRLIKECGDTFEEIQYERQTELVFEDEPFIYPTSILPGDALFVATTGKVMSVAKELSDMGFSVSQYYGKLPPQTKRQQIEDFTSGTTNVIVCTSSCSIGVNLPIRRLVFLDTKKYNGSSTELLTTQEVKQIAGRAGRRGMHEIGYVNSVDDREYIREQLTLIEKNILISRIEPSMELALLNIGTLKQRLTVWNEIKINIPYLEKADISQQFQLIQHIDKWESELGPEAFFKAINISFDTSNRALVGLWVIYVKQIKNGETSLKKPTYPSVPSQKNIETFYHSINLYYNFSKKFKLTTDTAFINRQRRRATQDIDYLISKNYSSQIS